MAIVSKKLSFILVIVSFNFPLVSMVDGETVRSTNKQTRSSSGANWRLPANSIRTVWNDANLAYEYELDQMVMSDMEVYWADRNRVDDSLQSTLDHGSEELLDFELDMYCFLEMLEVEEDMAIVSKKLSFKSYCGVPKCVSDRKSMLGMYQSLQQTE